MIYQFPVIMGVLITLLSLLALAFIAFIALWTVARLVLHWIDYQKAQRQWRRERFQPDGTPYPPSGRGICHQCQQACEKVYFMESGRRLCPTCFRLQPSSSTDSTDSWTAAPQGS